MRISNFDGATKIGTDNLPLSSCLKREPPPLRPSTNQRTQVDDSYKYFLREFLATAIDHKYY